MLLATKSVALSCGIVKNYYDGSVALYINIARVLLDLSSEPSSIRTGDRVENPDQLLEDLGSAIGLSSALSAFFLEKKMYDSRPVPLALGTGKE